MTKHTHANLLYMAANNTNQLFECDELHNRYYGIDTVTRFPEFNWRPWAGQAIPSDEKNYNSVYNTLKEIIERTINEFEVLSSFPQYDFDFVDVIKELRGCISVLENQDYVMRGLEFENENLSKELDAALQILNSLNEEPEAWRFIDTDGNRYLSDHKCLDEGINIPLCKCPNIKRELL